MTWKIIDCFFAVLSLCWVGQSLEIDCLSCPMIIVLRAPNLCGIQQMVWSSVLPNQLPFTIWCQYDLFCYCCMKINGFATSGKKRKRREARGEKKEHIRGGIGSKFPIFSLPKSMFSTFTYFFFIFPSSVYRRVPNLSYSPILIYCPFIGTQT